MTVVYSWRCADGVVGKRVVVSMRLSELDREAPIKVLS